MTEVAPDSAASETGLRPGDVIVAINRQPVENSVEAMNIVKKSKSDRLLLRVWSNMGGMNGTRFVVLRPAPEK